MSPSVLLATAALAVHVQGWTVLRVNQETAAVAPGGAVALCQAIPVTALTARLRASVGGPSVRVRMRAPGHRPRTRRVRLKRRTRVMFTARQLRLRDAAFPEGTYRLTVRRGGRTLDRATLHMRAGGNC